MRERRRKMRMQPRNVPRNTRRTSLENVMKVSKITIHDTETKKTAKHFRL